SFPQASVVVMRLSGGRAAVVAHSAAALLFG
ncbi:hypothetical protein SAMN05421507_1021, partial [Lentzea jiangxiensis]